MPIPERLAISDEELREYFPGTSLAERAHALFLQQRARWDLARQGYDGLGEVNVRSFELDGFPFTVQYNPARMTSSTAKVDEETIRARRCFLCTDHLPPQQRAILLHHTWLLLVNPFPIFPEHFTVANIKHVPQRIAGNLHAMLHIVRELGPGYTLFYNGPHSGASAPDHMHFQVGSRDFMPIDHEAPALVARHGRELAREGTFRLSAVPDILRPFFALESAEGEPLEEAVDAVISSLPTTEASPEEPMVNIIARWEGIWRVLIYPRARHRPSFFFEEGSRKILISPAAVDMGGLSIVPRREDFDKVSLQDLERMFSEVCPDPRTFGAVAKMVQERFRST